MAEATDTPNTNNTIYYGHAPHAIDVRSMPIVLDSSF